MNNSIRLRLAVICAVLFSFIYFSCSGNKDSKKETKKPAAKTAKEKQELKKAKKAENARKEF